MGPKPNYQIIAIQLSATANSRGYKHIEYVQITPFNQNNGWVARQALAEAIDAEKATAYVNHSGIVAVGVEHLNGVKYLRTIPDGTVEDNLLHLPTYNAAGQLLTKI